MTKIGSVHNTGGAYPTEAASAGAQKLTPEQKTQPTKNVSTSIKDSVKTNSFPSVAQEPNTVSFPNSIHNKLEKVSGVLRSGKMSDKDEGMILNTLKQASQNGQLDQLLKGMTETKTQGKSMVHQMASLWDRQPAPEVSLLDTFLGAIGVIEPPEKPTNNTLWKEAFDTVISDPNLSYETAQSTLLEMTKGRSGRSDFKNVNYQKAISQVVLSKDLSKLSPGVKQLFSEILTPRMGRDNEQTLMNNARNKLGM